MSNNSFHVIIPARYQSSRLPGKALLTIGDKPMIQHVYERCQLSKASNIVVATDDQRIVDVVDQFGGKAVMTSKSHQSGSDRIAQACRVLKLDSSDVVVNVQGDEPDMPAPLIDQVAQSLIDDDVAVMSTACAPLDSHEQVCDPSVVKVVRDAQGHAIYFSRATIPWVRSQTSSDLADNAMSHIFRHLGIYAYSAGYIQQFAEQPVCAIENLEKLEQLRVLWQGQKIRCVDAIEVPGPGIDTAEDLQRVRALFT